MIRRYDLRRSDNYMYTDKIRHYGCGVSGTINVVTGFPVTRAIVTFTTLPVSPELIYSSSSSSYDSSSSSSSKDSSSSSSSSVDSSSSSNSSSSSSSFDNSSSSSSSFDSSSSSSRTSNSSNSSSSSSFDSSSSSSSSNSSSSSSTSDPVSVLPRIYVSSYNSTGFVVTYQGIPADVNYIEFSYAAV